MTDSFNDIPAFVAAVEANGFSAAARRMHVSRSAVGKAIARLEARLSTRLFHRTTRNQTLTEDGMAFFEHCVRAMEELNAGKARLEVGRGSVSGRLRVSMPVLFGRLCIAPVLTKLAAANPDLELELQFTDRVVDLIEDGIDLSIRMGATNQGLDLITRRIAREQMTICCAPSLLNTGGLRSIEDLAAYNAVVYSRGGRLQNWLIPREPEPPLEYVPKSRLKFDDLQAIADAAICGHGIAWLPLWLIRDHLRSGELIRLFDEQPTSGFNIYALWPRMPYTPPRVRAALDALATDAPVFVST